MITKEQLVCSKDQSIKLKEKGVEQDSLFAWTEHKDPYGRLNLLDDNIGEGYAAFTSQELLEKIKFNSFNKFYILFKTKYSPVKLADILISQL